MLNFSACVSCRLREAGLDDGPEGDGDLGEFIELGCICATSAPDIVFFGMRNYRLIDQGKERPPSLLHSFVSIHSYSHAQQVAALKNECLPTCLVTRWCEVSSNDAGSAKAYAAQIQR